MSRGMAVAPEVPRTAREAAKQETREALLQAAIGEFAEKGLDLPSLDGICARAGFTRGAFYVHFRDREELLAAVMERVLDAVLDAVMGTEGAANDLATTVGRYTSVATFELSDAARRAADPGVLPGGVPFHQILAACQRNEATRASMERILGRAAQRLADAAATDQRRGRARDDVPPRDLAVILLILALGVRAAADLRLPVEVEPARDALLRLLLPLPRSSNQD
jgi:TetR/AcrR family transcriptional repressor of nem operon